MGSFDSYIFDMDGTLWDAVDSYCQVWNKTLADIGDYSVIVTRPMLTSLMGKPLETIYDIVVGRRDIHEKFMERLGFNERNMMPTLGGRLYSGVTDTLAELSGRAKLFMVSNCDVSGLPNFLAFTGLRPYITDCLSIGETGFNKDVNIGTIVARYNLQTPVYIGDTQGDCELTHRAGLPFVWAAYGFGRDVQGYDYKIDSIKDLLTLKR